ncbi:NUDIX domain-containing protein [Candidatus Kaiserbacteria bacterium]|nr:NUDIX domain-containing protein [Candidatus Kaiserbacteria bacterium]
MTPNDVERPVSNQPIPNDARLVFEGQLFDVFQWQQEQFDGSIRTFEKLKRPDTVVVIPVTPKGTILTTEQEQPGRASFRGLVGGRQESNESVYQTARREMQEEIGHTCDELNLWFATHPTTKIDWVVYYLVASGCMPSGMVQNDAGEKVKIVEKTFDEFLQLAFDDSFVEVEIIPEMLKALISKEKFENLKKKILG